jgi:hypothetical protein
MSLRENSSVSEEKMAYEKAEDENRVSIPIVLVLLCTGFVVLLAYGNQMQIFAGTPTAMGVNEFSSAAVGALIIAILIRKFIPIKRTYLLFVYGLVTTLGIVTHTVVGFAISNIVGPSKYYLVGEYLEWYERYSSLILPHNQQSLIKLWIGGSPVPWRDWIFPIILWTLYYSAFFWLILVVVRLIQRQWVETERLQYPLTRPIIDIVEGKIEGEAGKGSILKNTPWVIGVGIAVLYGFYNFLASNVAALPQVPYWIPLVERGFGGGLLNHSQLSLHIDPMLFGVALLLPLDLSFSIWFFFIAVFFVGGLIVENMGMLYYHFPAFRDYKYAVQIAAVGGTIAYAIILLRAFVAYLRRGPKDYLSKAFDNLGGIKFAAIITAIALVYIVTFATVLLGTTIAAVVLDLAFFLIGALIVVRFRAQLGFPEYAPTERFPLVATWALGNNTADLLRVDRYILTHLRDYSPFVGSAGMVGDSYMLLDREKVSSSSLTKWLVVLFPVCMAVTFAIALKIIYTVGFNMANAHVSAMGHSHFNWFIQQVFTKESNVVATWGVMALGAVVILCLYALYTRLVSWPFHPLALLLAMWGRAHAIWSMFFIAWLIKFFMIRWMGHGTAKRIFDALASGIIIGAALSSVVFTVINMIIVSV